MVEKLSDTAPMSSKYDQIHVLHNMRNYYIHGRDLNGISSNTVKQLKDCVRKLKRNLTLQLSQVDLRCKILS